MKPRYEKLKTFLREFFQLAQPDLENLKQPDDTWKVRLIEEDFHRLMFDAEGV